MCGLSPVAAKGVFSCCGPQSWLLCDLHDLPRPGIKPVSPCVGRQAPIHCTTREGPHWGLICVSLGVLDRGTWKDGASADGKSGVMHRAEGGFRCRGGWRWGVLSHEGLGWAGGSVCGGREGVRRGREASRPGDGGTRPRLPLRGLCGWWLEGPGCRA